MASASLSSDSAPDFAIAAYFSADLSIRNTPSFVASLARIASVRSESTRCCSVICEQLRRHIAIVDVVAVALGATIPGRLNQRFAQRSGYNAPPHLPTDSASPME